MNKLTNQEIAKVFAMYWGQKYHVCYNIEGVRVNGLINEKTIGDIFPDSENKRDLLALRLLPDITDEDANVIFNMATGFGGRVFTIERTNTEVIGNNKGSLSDFSFRCILWNDSDLVMVNDEEGDKDAIETQNTAFIFQYLISKGYAVPLYFGVGHWANGKNAIELGFAVDEKTLDNRP